MSVPGGFSPSVLSTLEFPAALERVAAHAAGPLGAARVRARRPGTDPDAVRAALAQVAELASLIVTDDSLRAAAVPDIASALELAAVPGSVLDPEALGAVRDALAGARATASELGRIAHLAPRTLALRAELPPKEIEPRLAAAIGPDGGVLDGASPALARARGAVREARRRIVARIEALLARLDAGDRSGDAVTLRNGRYVMPVRSGARARVGGIVHDESATGATAFVEPPEVIELNNDLRAKEAAEAHEVRQVLTELTALVRRHRDAIAAAWEMAVAFDDLAARARYAVAVNGFAPEIRPGPLVIRGGRHPLLEGGETVVVPFDLAFESDEWTVLVSGPNTGGKSVLIKAVALLVLLAQSGVIPPVGPRSAVPVFRSVFADIGDRQSIAESLSTFSARVADLRVILEAAGAGSLVLLDEIGSGTDPAEGGALAAAVLRALTRRRAVTLATTHLGALKQLAAETVGIVNASLQFDAETLSPTYRLVKGVPGRSYGLAIARRLGVPEAVMADAEGSLSDAERALDRLLADVERRGREVDARALELDSGAARLDREREALAARIAELDGLAAELEARSRAADRSARDEARRYLLEARRKVEEALAQARAAVDETTAREARKLVEGAIAGLGAESEEAAGRPGGWMSLDELRRRLTGGPAAEGSLGDEGRPRPGGHAGLGGARATPVAARRAEDAAMPAEGERTPGSPRRVPRPARPARGGETPVGASANSPASEVNLIGLRVDEAEPVLLRALDAAVLAELPFLRIVHGKGTGALRDLVARVLAADPRVERFAPAPAAQGGTGATVADLAR